MSKETEKSDAPIELRSVVQAMRVVGRDVEIEAASGGKVIRDRGDVVEVSAEEAKRLFREGSAIPEEMRPEGAPAGTEKR